MLASEVPIAISTTTELSQTHAVKNKNKRWDQYAAPTNSKHTSKQTRTCTKRKINKNFNHYAILYMPEGIHLGRFYRHLCLKGTTLAKACQ